MKKAVKRPKDKRYLFRIPVTIEVLADTKAVSKDVVATVQNYLNNYIPDEAPNDSLHIVAFSMKDFDLTVLPADHPYVIKLKKEMSR